MDKIVVTDYESFKKEAEKIAGDNCFIERESNFEVLKDKDFYISFTFYKVNDIKSGVKSFNNFFDVNFEYKSVKIIDTLEKLEEFQKELSEREIYFDRKDNTFFSRYSGLYSIKEVEKAYNVELIILKGE